MRAPVGRALPIDVADRFLKLTSTRLGGGWGMTETSPAGTAMPREWSGKVGSVGLPLPGILMDIVALDDPQRPPSRPGEKGEIRIKGPNVTKGYWNAPAETGRRLRRRLLADRRHRLSWTRTAISISSTARRT